MAAGELSRQGWHLTEEGVAGLANKGNAESIIKRALDTDLRSIGAAWLSEDVNRGRLDYIEGPSVLQLQKLRIVSAPKDNEESQAAPKICRLSVTDGHVTCSAVTLEPIKGLGLNTPPGSKLLLAGTVEVETNFLLLTNKNTTLLGGRVSSLADTWELKKSLAKQSLTRASMRGEGGPPPFVPFGNKITSDLLPPPVKDNFRSLSNNKEKKTPEGDTEFQQQRQAALNEALQVKGTSKGGKTFGGGKFLVSDKDVARIMEMGFSAEEATSSLKASGGDVNEAINSLLSGGQRYQRFGDRGKPAMRGGGGGGFDGRGDGRRRGREREMEGDGDDPINTRPSGPATLFDFLETKISTKEESKKSSKASDIKAPSSSSSSPVSNDSLVKFSKDSNGDRPRRRPEPPHTGHTHTPSGYKDGQADSQDTYRRGKDDFNFSHRGPQQQQQQNVPPRFARLGRGDAPRRNDGGGGGYRGERNDGGGYGGGYKGERNDGGGGYRGERNDGGGGYRGERNDGGGGYRGERNDGGGGGYRGEINESGGGYRGERNDGGGGGYRGEINESGGGYRGERNDRGGYRGNRNDGGGGYRGNRNDGGGGYRGNRNDGGGGYRGERNDGGGYRGERNYGGGYKGERNDEEGKVYKSERNDGGGGYRGDGNSERGGYRGERNDGGEKAYEIRNNTHSDQSQNVLKESGQSQGKSLSGSGQESKSQTYQEQPNDQRQQYSDQHSSSRKKQPYVQSVDVDKNDFGGQSVRKDGDSNRHQNYGNSNQYKNSNRSDSRDSDSKGGLPHPHKSQSNSRPYNQQPALMPTPYSHQQPQEAQFTAAPGKQGYSSQQFTFGGSVPLTVGCQCLARYWDDNQFYPAVIDAIAQDGSTVVVTFTEYGNQEEVFVEDIQPTHQSGWTYHIQPAICAVSSMSTSLPDPSSFQGAPQFVPAMEFTRSSYGSGGRRHDNNERRRPTQSHYLPPSQRQH